VLGAGGAADAGGGAVLAEDLAQHLAPFAGGDARLGAAMEGSMTLRPSCAAARSSAERLLVRRFASRAARQALRLSTCWASTRRIDHHDRAFARGERRGFGLGEAVDADDDLLAALDGLEARVLLSTSLDFM
jgi:hypothetical protein